jgi:hypothetical protein
MKQTYALSSVIANQFEVEREQTGAAEVAEPPQPAAFLGSPEAACITGAILPVAGGRLAGMNVIIEDLAPQ